MKTKLIAGLFAALMSAFLAASAHAQTSARFLNISTRAFVGTGDNVAIAGFITGPGSGQKRVLIRVVGPGIEGPPYNVPGVLKAPMLSLYNSNGLLLRTNTSWDHNPTSDGPLNSKAAATVGAFPLAPNSNDCAITVFLFPNSAYTVIASGVNGATGVALLEVYELPDNFTP